METLLWIGGLKMAKKKEEQKHFVKDVWIARDPFKEGNDSTWLGVYSSRPTVNTENNDEFLWADDEPNQIFYDESMEAQHLALLTKCFNLPEPGTAIHIFNGEIVETTSILDEVEAPGKTIEINGRDFVWKRRAGKKILEEVVE
jgi:hypothetical protein